MYTCFLPEALAQGAVLRLRRPGDRIVPFGSSSAKKLKDVYIARKCTPQQKDLPVLEKDGVLLWAVGAAAAEQCRIAAGMPVLRLRYEPINEGGKTNA